MARARRTSPDLDPLNVLRETRSPRVRNEAALALLAIGTPKAAEAIVELLGRSDTKGARGTLLYVLNEMNAHVPLATLVEIIVGESYEAQEEALSLLRKTKFAPGERTGAMVRLKPYKQSRDPHMSLLAAEALEALKR